jgi:PhzF family phenazine biosynthesis protein
MSPPMPRRRFKQVDVFTAVPYHGNALAVVLDGSGLDADDMQRFADWTNLSEATFLLPPTHAQADYAVRIFCPGRELPFAGHPTLGSCHAWLEAGGTPKGDIIVQQCEAGLIRIRRDGGRLAFAAPPLLRTGPLPEEDVALLARGLGLERRDIVAHAWCNNGPEWQGLLLDSADRVLAARPDPVVLRDRFVGIVGPHAPGGGEVDFEVRAFFPGQSGVTEDPVTGSFNAALGQWLIGTGRAQDRYVASQGTALRRRGRVYLERDARGETWVGGHSVTCIEGSVLL